MTQTITMPALSDTMSNGRLVKWTKKPGDSIKKGEVIAEVETDKAVMDVEAFQDGFLSGPLAAEGTEAPVGQIIGYIVEKPGETANAAPSLSPPPSASRANGPPSLSPPPSASRASGPESQASATASVSPVVAASMAGTGPSRRPIVRSSSAPARPAASLPSAADPVVSALKAGPPYQIERASSLREAVARNMIAAAATPSFRVTAQLPLGAVIKSAAQRQQSLTLLLARACAMTIAAHPLFNAAYTPDGLARRDRVDIAIAVDDGEGLITPVLRDAARKSLAQLAEDWGILREKVKSRRLKPADYSGATFYLSNLGAASVVHAFDSIVPVGVAAILSVAAARPEGTLCTLACDHRVVFGADAARFLSTLAEQIKDPGKLTG